VSFISAINEAIDFGEPTDIHDPLKLLAPVGTHYQDDLIDLVTLFETVNRMSNYRFVADEAQQFIKSHPLAAASRYYNGGDHGESVSVRGSCQRGALCRQKVPKGISALTLLIRAPSGRLG
jgi:hypothetical protein